MKTYSKFDILRFAFTYLNPIYEIGSSLVWVATLYPLVVTLLWIKNHRKIKFFSFRSWHLSSRYLLSTVRGEKVFVKCGKHFLISNELTALSRAEALGFKFTPKIINCYVSKFLPINFISIQYLDDYKSLENVGPLSMAEFRDLSDSLREVVGCLRSIQIVHRDLRPSNIFVSKNSYRDVKVIDFSMACGVGMKPIKFGLKTQLVELQLGSGYKPERLRWDDAYSVEKIIAGFARSITNDQCIDERKYGSSIES